MERASLTLVYLGHLNWDHVWQRPQQLMSRFARHCRVIYVDPPRLLDGAPGARLEERPGAAGVRVRRPIFPTEMIEAPGAATNGPTERNGYQRLWLQLLPEILAEAGPNVMLWVSSPLADYLVAEARDRVEVAVYDCMDDLASFKDGTAEMRRRETNLLEHVDLLFTGGYSMWEARKDLHPRAYCFPSGVDVDHYRRVLDLKTRVPVAVERIPRPHLGYFGVLDERIDWPLVEVVARQRPDWHWLLVGPRAKIKRSELPIAANIHYLGKQPYARLPAFLKGFDIATMPFALNEATRYISPTKTLEYLAGGRPVISTSVPDVVAFYQGIVQIADGAEAWIAAVEEILSASKEELRERLVSAQPVLHDSSWDGIVERMWELMQDRMAHAATV